MAEQSPELMALHPEIGEVIAQRKSATRIASQASAMGEGRNQSLKEARIVAAKKIMAGTHLQLQAYDAIANSSDPRITDAQRAYAATQAETMRGRAVGLLRMMGMESDAATEASPAIQESDGNKAMEPPRTSSMKAGHWAGKTVDNPLEITNKQNENEQDHEHAIRTITGTVSGRNQRGVQGATAESVEGEQQSNAEGNQLNATSNDRRVILLQNWIDAGGIDFSGSGRDLENARQQVKNALEALKERTSGVRVNPESQYHKEFSYNRLTKTIEINPVKLAKRLSLLQVYLKDIQPFVRAGILEESTHHEINEEILEAVS